MSELTVITNASIDPICAACKEKIGAMPLDVYLRAVEARGEYLLCPECRKHQCDCCGWFIPAQEVSPCWNSIDGFLGNACDTCLTFVVPIWMDKIDFPHFRLMKKPNLQWVRPPIDPAQEDMRAEEGERWEG